MLVIYGDYQCPNSGAAYKMIQMLQQQFIHQVCVVFRHFPQPQKHPQAQIAAQVAEAAAAQGLFWQMHDVLFKYQHALDDSSLVEYANELKLDIPKFLQDISRRINADRIQQDIDSGIANGVCDTPTIFINSIWYQGDHTLEQLEATILRSM
ncbi:hypothetical protein CFPU101_40410 [Chroococcus sp. FPU101]|nr:hypothetical protein CFPU101_40410 [Chroococcus sp. FPU101]